MKSKKTLCIVILTVCTSTKRRGRRIPWTWEKNSMLITVTLEVEVF